MPHLTVEVPAELASKIDWRRFFVELHKSLDASGYRRLEDFKSRVIVVEHLQVADSQASASLVFVTLQTMDPWPAEMLRTMGKIVHERLELEVIAVTGAEWVQCCVRVTSTPP